MKPGLQVMAWVTITTLAAGATAVPAGRPPVLNPPAAGFDMTSDQRAMDLADRTMTAMGGREAWDRVRTIGWTIFNRNHVWDKMTGDYRLEADTVIVIMNIHTKQGRVWSKGSEITDAAKRDQWLRDGMSIWINDSYWLLMPYKLKDTGVTLRYLGRQETQDGRDADVIQLTFSGVGDTPENKYHVWIDLGTALVSQWAYFEKAADMEPKFTRPWTNWTTFDGIKIALGRGKVDVTNVRVSNSNDKTAFSGP